MKAEQILEVLMNDDKYKARVEELRALNAQLSEKARIVDTIEKAKALEHEAMIKESNAKARQAEIEEYFQQRKIEVNDELTAKKLELEERAVKEREQFKGARDHKVAGDKALEQARQLQETANQQTQSLKVWEQELQQREAVLAARIKRINEAFNG